MEDAHREFLRITDVTERISESNICLTDTSVGGAIRVSGDVVMVDGGSWDIEGRVTEG